VTSRPADRTEHPTFDDVPVIAALDENPARWLDRELTTADVTGAWIRSLVDGIDSYRRLAAWEATERRLGRGPDGDPRSGVLAVLDARRDELDAQGERPDRLRHGPRRPPASFDRDDDADVFEWVDRDDDRRGATAGGTRGGR
jgi:hypothetical protein